MTQFPRDDQPLVYFLRQYRPASPKASVHLESQIMTEVLQWREMTKRRVPLWLVSSGVVVSGLLSWISYQMWVPVSPSPAELANLEMFLQGNWESVISEPAEPSWLSVINLPVWQESSGVEHHFLENP